MFKDSSGQRRMWQALFQERRAFFALTAAILSPTREATEHVLSEALLAVERTPFCGDLSEQSAILAVVTTALVSKASVQASYAKPRPVASKRDEHCNYGPLDELPWAERTAFYLRNVLHYSRGDSALLIGVSDPQVDQLIALAERRIATLDTAEDGSSAAFSEMP